MNSPTEQAHINLTNVLLNGRILVNGSPLTANELGTLVQGEKQLYEKAVQFEQAGTAKKEDEPDIAVNQTPKG